MFNSPFKKDNDNILMKFSQKASENDSVKNGNRNPNISNAALLSDKSDDSNSSYSIYVDNQFQGFLRLSCNVVEGWLAEHDAKPLTRKLVATAAGHSPELAIKEVPYPTAPYIDQPPSNAQFFQIDLASALIRKDYLNLQINERLSEDNQSKTLRKIMSLTASSIENKPINENPCLYSDSTISIQNWEIANSDIVGLRIDDFSQNKPFSTYSRLDPSIKIAANDRETLVKAKAAQSRKLVCPTRYSRIALTESRATGSPLTLTTVLSVSKELEDKELKIAIVLRADRTTRFNARLIRNKKAISCVSFNAETHWTEVRRQFDGSLSLPRHKTAEYKLEIDVMHRGRGYIDIIACSVSTNPSIQTVLQRTSDTFQNKNAVTTIDSSLNYVRNGDFSKWSNGFVFDRIQPKQETADSWRVDCRNESAKSVNLSLYQLHDKYIKANCANVRSKFGIHICTQKFDGPLRLVSIVAREFQDAKNVSFKLDIFAPGQAEPKRVIKRILLLGKSVGHEEVLHVISRNILVRFEDSYTFNISENELVKIRAKSSNHSNVQIAIELEQDVNIVISSVQMLETEQNTLENELDSTSYRLEREVKFEDPAITEQSSFLKGLETWRNESNISQVFTRNKLSEDQGETTGREASEDTENRINSLTGPVDIIVPIHNALAAVQQCLNSILVETFLPYTVYCIDDASNIETFEWVKSFCEKNPQFRFYANEENLGYTKSVNRGLREATSDWVCVLNSDAIVTRNWLERLINVALSDQKIGIISPLSNAASYQSVPRVHNDNDADNGWCFNPLPESVSPNDVAEAVWNSSLAEYPDVGVSNGFCQLINSKMLEEIGVLDEESFPRGFGEENDLCARATKAGWRIKIADDTYVYHIKSQSFGHDQRKGLSALGKEALLRKHPDIDWNKITEEFENLAPLVELRKRLVKQGL